MSDRELALLRGINVGGKHSVPMASLAEVFTALGCRDVQTYIQSGNVVYIPADGGIDAESIAAAIERRFGFAVPVIVRSQAAVKELIAANPFATPAANPQLLHVVFLAAPLGAAQMDWLRGMVTGGEQIVAAHYALYLSLPNGAGRSKLALGCVAPRLPPTNTMRNWATVLKLEAMLSA